jgi:hypothetical protein
LWRFAGELPLATPPPQLTHDTRENAPICVYHKNRLSFTMIFRKNQMIEAEQEEINKGKKKGKTL